MLTTVTLQKIKKGDNIAFRQCFDTYHSKVFYYLMRFCRNEDDAEDLTQKVFIKLWECRKSIDLKLDFDAYLFTIAHHTACNFLRDKARQQECVVYDMYPDTSTEDLIRLNELKVLTEEGVEQLPEKRKLIFRMFYDDRLSVEEIAEMLQLSVHTVKSQLLKANDKIRGIIRHAAHPGLNLLFWYLWQH